MAIGTQQSQVTAIRRPVGEAATPTVLPFFGLNLRRRVNVVDVQYADVVNTTSTTLAAKLLNEFQLSLPVSTALVSPIPGAIPERRAAGFSAKPHLTTLAALVAFAARFPAMLQVALPSAVFPGSVANAVRMNRFVLAAVGALNGYLWCSHGFIVREEPKYFDIAVKRIEAELNRAPLFDEAPAVVQRELI